MTAPTYLNPTQKQSRALFSRNIAGSVVMLNLLRFRAVAEDSRLLPLVDP
jgi:hypothetical protein